MNNAKIAKYLIKIASDLLHINHFSSWHKTDLNEEYEEIERTANELNIDLNELIKAFKNAKLEFLNENDWQNMEDTDSYQTDTVEKAQEAADKYERDIGRIFSAFKNDKSLPAPIVLFKKGNNPYCIAGNTRLMASRAYNIKPEVLAVYL